MLEDVLAFASLPLAAAVVFTGIHTWFGLQVLRRNVVFADLALAQVSALGATVAVVAGHAVQSPAGYAYTLAFTAVGANLFSSHVGVALLIGWAAGAVASAAGIFGSFLLDAPTGAVTVLAFAATLLIAGAIRAFITAPATQ